MHKLTDPICVRFGLPTAALDIKPDTLFSTTASGVEGLGDLHMGGIGTVISAVIATVVAMVVGGAGMSLLTLPLIGQIVVGVVAFIGLMVGKEAVIDATKDWDIPTLGRLFLTDARIDGKLSQSEPQLVEGLKQDVATNEAGAAEGAKLRDRVALQIDQALKQRADDAVLRFN